MLTPKNFTLETYRSGKCATLILAGVSLKNGTKGNFPFSQGGVASNIILCGKKKWQMVHLTVILSGQKL